MGYEDDTTIYAVILTPLSLPQVMVSLNRDLVAIHAWCLKWHIRLSPKKAESMVISRTRTSAPGYGDLTLGSAEIGEVRCLRILEVTFNYKFTFETHLRVAVSKAARILSVVRRAGNLFDYVRVLKSYFNSYVLPNLEYCAPVCMSSADTQLSLLDTVVRST